MGAQLICGIMGMTDKVCGKDSDRKARWRRFGTTYKKMT